MGCKRRRMESRESLQSTVVEEQSRGSVVVVAAEEERSNGGEEAEESGWTTYLDQQPLSLSPRVQEPQARRPQKRSLARQDSTLSVLSDASSGPLTDHRSQEQAGENILKSLFNEDNESEIDNGAFEAIERQLRVLRRLIPDGNKFHNEEMLDKAIEYVHFLQRKIQIFESKWRCNLQEQGLCLIPVSMLKLV
ncbi:uncharacterized protein LOC9632831 [Selaginella moellendorffii]|uniref:uncharacterized protein LOC9632831 n=1 Tax=Selaginella moellendorffii TaxID=88036 RepID=UPI000D1C6660|nr:uncharacterized protein LOC9632831 [Selaginella moellendorffii]|eukprot:XP_024528641.1 uncharacterized protein LOC9632831 [Selaginella moellendorffii]